MFKLQNQVTGEIAKTGQTPSELKNWAIRTGLFKVERSKNFRHVIYGDWDIKRA